MFKCRPIKSTQDWLDGYNIQNYIKFSQKSLIFTIFLRFLILYIKKFLTFDENHSILTPICNQR